MAEGSAMGLVVTVMNMKGGVGKTTVAMHLAGMAAQYGLGRDKPRKVLLIDYDAQFNLSQAFLRPDAYFRLEKERKTTIAILLDNDADLNPYELQVPGNYTPPKASALITNVYNTRDGGRLDIIPSTLDLMYVALGQSHVKTEPIEERFQKFMNECKNLYDIIFIDCHPAGSLFTKTSLVNSDHVLIPVIPQRYAVRGIGLMLEFISAKRPASASPTPHILFNATSRTGTAPEEERIRADSDFANYCMTNALRRYKAFSDPESGAGFVWFSGKPYSTEAFRNVLSVTREFLTRIEG
jgi:chromosome partitioning protein